MILYRPKITTRSLVSPSTVGRPLRSRSRKPTARRSSNITPTRRQLRAALRMISSSSAFRRPLKSFLTPSGVVSMIPSTKKLMSSPRPRNSFRRATSTSSGARYSSQKLDSLRSTLFPPLEMPIPPRSRSRISTTSGTTLTAGAHSNTWTKMSQTTTKTATRSALSRERTPTPARRRRPKTTPVCASC